MIDSWSVAIPSLRMSTFCARWMDGPCAPTLAMQRLRRSKVAAIGMFLCLVDGVGAKGAPLQSTLESPGGTLLQLVVPTSQVRLHGPAPCCLARLGSLVGLRHHWPIGPLADDVVVCVTWCDLRPARPYFPQSLWPTLLCGMLVPCPCRWIALCSASCHMGSKPLRCALTRMRPRNSNSCLIGPIVAIARTCGHCSTGLDAASVVIRCSFPLYYSGEPCTYYPDPI